MLSNQNVRTLLKSESLPIPFKSWNYFHYSFASRAHTRREILEGLFSPQTQLFTFAPSDTFNGYQFELVPDFFSYLTISPELNICTSGKEDLVNGFRQGRHLRWKVKKDGKTVALASIMKPRRGNKFKTYIIGPSHSEKENLNPDLQKAYKDFIVTYYKKITASYNKKALSIQSN